MLFLLIITGQEKRYPSTIDLDHEYVWRPKSVKRGGPITPGHDILMLKYISPFRFRNVINRDMQLQCDCGSDMILNALACRHCFSYPVFLV